MGSSGYCVAQPARQRSFSAPRRFAVFECPVEPIAAPFELGAQSAFEPQHAADARDIKIRARRQQNQMIAGGTMGFEHGERGGSNRWSALPECSQRIRRRRR